MKWLILWLCITSQLKKDSKSSQTLKWKISGLIKPFISRDTKLTNERHGNYGSRLIKGFISLKNIQNVQWNCLKNPALISNLSLSWDLSYTFGGDECMLCMYVYCCGGNWRFSNLKFWKMLQIVSFNWTWTTLREVGAVLTMKPRFFSELWELHPTLPWGHIPILCIESTIQGLL